MAADLASASIFSISCWCSAISRLLTMLVVLRPAADHVEGEGAMLKRRPAPCPPPMLVPARTSTDPETCGCRLTLTRQWSSQHSNTFFSEGRKSAPARTDASSIARGTGDSHTRRDRPIGARRVVYAAEPQR